MDTPFATYLSVIVPTYRYVKALPHTLRALAPVVAQASGPVEVILVEDGSPESEQAAIAELVRAFPFVRLICLAQNLGQYSAIAAGIRYSVGEYVVTFDDDLRYPPAGVLELVRAVSNGAWVAYGRVPSSPKRNFSRAVLNAWAGKPFTTSFRAFHHSVLPPDRNLPANLEAYWVKRWGTGAFRANRVVLPMQAGPQTKTRHSAGRKWRFVRQHLPEFPRARVLGSGLLLVALAAGLLGFHYPIGWGAALVLGWAAEFSLGVFRRWLGFPVGVQYANTSEK